MPDGKFCNPASLLLLSFRLAWRKGFPKDEIVLPLSGYHPSPGEKTVVKKKTQLCDPRLRKTSSSVGEGKGVDRDGSKKKSGEPSPRISELTLNH